VNIFERAVSPKTIGAGVVLWPNATLILSQLGLLQSIEAHAGSPKEMRRVSSSGDVLGSLDIGIIDKQIGSPSFSISRSALINVLLGAFKKSGGQFHCDHPVIDILSNPDMPKASIRFKSGLLLTPEVIIGAEGRMNSPSRDYVLGNNKPVFQKFINWVGILENHSFDMDENVVLDYWGVGARFGVVPLSPSSAYWAAGITTEVVSEKQPKHYHDEIESVFKHWPHPILPIVNATPLHKINKIYVHDHDPIKTWHKDNVILVGDAAHAPLPTSGQGACQAIEDAWHIAEALSGDTGELQVAFKRFTEVRQEKTANITLSGRQFAQTVFNDDPEFCRSRDETSKSTDFDSLAKAMATGWSTA
jgi:2-polyprenyl-6-methoxyphenol hydroxylase-like FAD-dependent oxidoreductase